ncbi:uncharacterized protein [Rutidosis leptorrhynchoides]|uniref:uncharacterized protein n=1 Tax=Rutidosis leptorrhynchoides TaxID=125765 RepID=UPI003A99C57A
MCKLKAVKNELKAWSKAKFGMLDSEIEFQKQLAHSLEIKVETGNISSHKLDMWKEAHKGWFEKEKNKASMLKQKARVHWALEGDENTKFFHSIIRGNYNRCNICGLTINGVWSDNPEEVKFEAFKHFSRLFEENNDSRPLMEDLNYPVLSSDEANELEHRFTEAEILEAINDYGSTKAPGPDGFNLRFFKKFWDVIKVDLVEVINWFWEKEVISRGCNASFVTLIPKKVDPLGLGDYRSISLIGSYYKVVAKILSNRLRKVIPSLVGVEQSAFIKGRFILDGALIANETVDFVKAKHKKASGLKVNYHKSYVYGIGVDSSELENLSHLMGCQVGNFPFIYLGLPIGSKMKKLHDWDPVIEKFKKRLSSWKMKSLSFGERLTLVKSVLSSLFLYYFSLYRTPPSVIKLLESVRRNFFWGASGSSSKLAWVKWDRVINSYENGGLNIESLRSKNLALLGKWWWRFKTETNTLWVKVIRSIYGDCGGLMLDNDNNHYSSLGAWHNIVLAGKAIEESQVPFINSFTKKIGNGGLTSFWHDHWIDEDKLCIVFPGLYRLDLDTNVSIRDRLGNSSVLWN